MIEYLAHLIRLPAIIVKDRDQIEAAVGHCRNGIDFDDVTHLAASKACSDLLTFNNRGYALGKKASPQATGPGAYPLIASYRLRKTE